MAEAKDIDDSLDFLRFFEKYTENPDLGTLIQEKISPDKKSLELSGSKLNETDFKALSDFSPIKNLKHLNLNQTGLNSTGLQPLCTSDSFSNLETLTLANNNLGTLLNEIGRETEAIRYYVRAIEINPDQAVFHFNLANTHTLLGNDYQALQSYKEALRIDPRMDESIARRGKLLLQQGKHREGLERLRMAEGHISISYSEICIH